MYISKTMNIIIHVYSLGIMLKSHATVLDHLSHRENKPAHLLHPGAIPALCTLTHVIGFPA